MIYSSGKTRLWSLVLILCISAGASNNADALSITAPVRLAISSGQNIKIDSTAATFSELGWDLSLRDHSASTGNNFYTKASGPASGSDFIAPTVNTPSFTTEGGLGVAGIITRQPYLYADFSVNIPIAANKPELITLWLGTTLTSTFAARLNDNSAMLAPTSFSTPTMFQLVVTSTVAQDLIITSAKSPGGQVGLWASAASAAVPEPNAIVLTLIASIGLAVAPLRLRPLRRIPRTYRRTTDTAQM